MTAVDTGTAAGLDMVLEDALHTGRLYETVEGRVVPWNQWADIGLFVERFERGAFTASLAHTPNIPLLLWHDNRRFPAGHATDWADEPDGLYARFELAPTLVAQEAARSAERGDMVGLSVGFGPIRSTWSYPAKWAPDHGPDHMDKVTRHEARLHEVSLTPTPAYPGARISRLTSVAWTAADHADYRRHARAGIAYR